MSRVTCLEELDFVCPSLASRQQPCQQIPCAAEDLYLALSAITMSASDYADTYDAPEPSPSDIDATPSESPALPAKIRERVDAATENTRGRCLISNVNSEYAVEYAHVLQRAASDALVC